jgi:hypothetical protein
LRQWQHLKRAHLQDKTIIQDPVFAFFWNIKHTSWRSCSICVYYRSHKIVEK